MLMQKTHVRSTSHLSFLQCPQCFKKYPANEVNTFASCDQCTGNALLARYVDTQGSPEDVIDRNDRSMWRYFPLLPLADRENIVTMGEGFTPILL